MDFKPRIPAGLVERLVGLSGLQRAYFGVQNAGRNVACPPQGPLLSDARTPGQVAARINGDVSKGRHHTVTVRPTREYAPPARAPIQELQPSPLVARIRFAQDGCWAEVDVDVKRGINVTVPATMIEVVLHNEGPLSVVNIEGVETVGRIVDAAVFIDEMPYFKRHNATRTHRLAAIPAGDTSPPQPIPAFATELVGLFPGQTFSPSTGIVVEFLDENGGLVMDVDYFNAPTLPNVIPVPNGATQYTVVNFQAGPYAPVLIWELAF